MTMLTHEQKKANEVKEIIDSLFEKLLERKKLLRSPQVNDTSSYTVSLFKRGVSALNEKVAEESEETIEAAVTLSELKQKQSETQTPTLNKSIEVAHAHLVNELADVFYHLLALAAYSDVPLEDIKKELYKRSLPKP